MSDGTNGGESGGDSTDASSVGAVNGSDAMSDSYGGVGPGGFAGDGVASDFSGFPDLGDVGSISVTGSMPTSDESFAGYNASGAEASPYAQRAQQVVINGVKGAALSSLFGQAAPVVNAGISAFGAPEGKKGGAFMGALSPMLLGPLAPIHSLVTSLLGIPSMGQSIAAHGGYSGADGQSNSFGAGANTGSNDWGTALGGLAGLYSMYSRNRDSDKFTSTLANMYGQNSPYAKQLAQSLARRDAASGRRTQYGPREVELQAQLAKMQAGVAPSVMQGQQNGFNNSMQMMQQLAALHKMGAFNGLSNLFTPNFNYGQAVQDWSPAAPITDVGWDG